MTCCIPPGSNSLGTVLTISGSGFDDGNATVWIGRTECTVVQVTGETNKTHEIHENENNHGETCFPILMMSLNDFVMQKVCTNGLKKI